MKKFRKKMVSLMVIAILLMPCYWPKEVEADDDSSYNIGGETLSQSQSPIKGDANLDGMVTSYDALLIQECAIYNKGKESDFFGRKWCSFE